MFLTIQARDITMSENIKNFRRPDYLMVVPDVNSLNRAAVNEIAVAAETAISEHSRFTIALSGGNTPRGVYSMLAEKRDTFPWAKTFFFFGDERSVAPDHPDSNYRMAKEALFSKAPVPEQNVFRVPAELGAEKAADKYQATLREFFKAQSDQWPRFDLILLGIGDEGHTASLFPDSAALAETSRLVAPNWIEKLKTNRITFTFPLINSAAETMFLVAGPGKAEIVKNVFLSEREIYPVQRVRPARGRLLWIVDQAAASLL
jgi:6-phosphogluconolactonase